MRPCIFVIGTRAQLVKVAPVLRCAISAGLCHTVWLSGQHQESIDDLLEDFEIGSSVHSAGGSEERATVTALLTWLPQASVDCFRYVKRVSAETGRALVVVHGDTLSTLVSAYAARFADAEVVHLESGLTSNRLFDPFPEEMLRRLTFRITDYAICPGSAASSRMQRYPCKEVVDTLENTLLDSVRYVLNGCGVEQIENGEPYFVASIHRVQNIYRRKTLSEIVRELKAVSNLSQVQFVLHPSTKRRLLKTGLWDTLAASPGIRLMERMPYSRFLSLLAGARAVFSDGGSNQEELSYLGVPTVLFRSRSERPEGIGRNIVMRDEVGNLCEFVRSGRIDELRLAAAVHSSIQPSRIAVEALQRWSSER